MIGKYPKINRALRAPYFSPFTFHFSLYPSTHNYPKNQTPNQKQTNL